MPYRSEPPDQRRREVARRLYVDEAREAPDWIDQELLRPIQVAALFQVSVRSINAWVRQGKLRAIATPGGHKRFLASEVRALAESREYEPRYHES